MAGSHVQITNGTGPYLATGPNYTEASTSVQDQKVNIGLPYLAAYNVNNNATTVNAAAGGAHLIQLMAGASLNVYVKRLRVFQLGTTVSAAAILQMAIVRLVSAGSGSLAVTPSPLDPADPAAGATSILLPSTHGTEAAFVSFRVAPVWLTIPTAANSSLMVEWYWGDDWFKCLKIAAGTANGIALKTLNSLGGNTALAIEAEFFEAPF